MLELSANKLVGLVNIALIEKQRIMLALIGKNRNHMYAVESLNTGMANWEHSMIQLVSIGYLLDSLHLAL